MKGWILVVLSAVLQVGWLLCLRQTEGLKRPVPLVLYALFGLASTWCLSRALLQIPLSAAYAVWTGISVAGAVAVDMLVFRQASAGRILCILLILAGSAGLRAFAPASAASP